MRKWFVVLGLLLSFVPALAQDLEIVGFRDAEIDLFDPKSGEYSRSLSSKDLSVPVKIIEEMGNGTYLIAIDDQQVCVDAGAVQTNKVYHLENIRDCNNSVKANHVAATRGLGKGCME